MRLIGYCRVSDKEQAVTGYSIEAQQETITEWCQTHKHHLVQVFTEPGRSGSKPSQETRPGFEYAIQLILMGAADGLVVKWMDRFARNVEDFIRVRSQLFQMGKQLISISEPMLNGDPSDPVARYIAVGIMNAYQLQAELTGVKSAQGRARRARQGKYPGVLPVGYTRQEKTIAPDPDYAPVVVSGFVEFANGGHTLDTWVNESTARGYVTRQGKPFNKSLWHRILRNRFYIGFFTWNGEEYQGDYQPLVSQEMFAAVQEILDGHSTGPSYRTRFWLLSGLLWSDPAARVMTGNLAKGQYAYYRAYHPGRPEHLVNAAEIEERVINTLGRIIWDEENPYSLPEHWRLAFRVSPSMREIYASLETDQERQSLLRMIFFQKGVRVSAGGAIIGFDLKPGFLEVS
jgi:DNA invertase Pin-like site-specific DNA recombinase